jgi:ATP-dependent protease ClpP protease subunit
MENKKQLSQGYEDDNSFPISYEPHRSGTYHIYMFGQIVCPTQFIGAIEVMRMATENDTVVINLQSCGGSLDATDTLIQAMRECEAPIVVRASGGVHSAGTLILLEADHFTLSENFSSLIHNGSTGAIGKFSDYKSETMFTAKWFEKILRRSYEGFLSQQEIEDVLKGVDLWLDAEDWMERAHARNEYIKGRVEEVCQCQDCVPTVEATKKPRKPRKKVEEVLPVE